MLQVTLYSLVRHTEYYYATSDHVVAVKRYGQSIAIYKVFDERENRRTSVYR